MEALEGVEGAVLLCDGSVDGVETLPATGCIHVPDRHDIHSPDVVSFTLPVQSLDPPSHAILFFNFTTFYTAERILKTQDIL